MVVLSVAIVSKNRTLLARQFVEMTRIRVEGLLNTFPKLLDSSKDHTFIETETVRYVYQPLEQLYVVLITNKTSNILEDLETLKLMAKVVQETCTTLITEDLIAEKSFDLIFALDEVISFGYRESVTISQIKTFTEMDSHEEKLFLLIEESKMKEAQAQARKRAGELAKVKKADGPVMPGISSLEKELESLQQSHSGQQTMNIPSIPLVSANSPWAQEDPNKVTNVDRLVQKGMALGKKPALFSEAIGGGMSMGGMGGPGGAMGMGGDAAEVGEPEPAEPEHSPLKEPLSVVIEEQVTALLNAEGVLQNEIEVQGKFDLVVASAQADQVCFQLGDMNDALFKYKSNPVLNKLSQAKGLLEPKDPSRPTYQPNVTKPLLKWIMKSKDDHFIPITLSCWPSPTPDGASVTLEYELKDESRVLEEIHIRFPCPPHGQPEIQSADQGQTEYDGVNHQLHWYIPQCDANEPNGTLEFTAKCDIASLMPFTFEARSKQLVNPLEIRRVYHQTRGEDLQYAHSQVVTYQFTYGT